MPTLDERLIEAATGALELYSIQLGRELGLYQLLADVGPVTAGQLAEKAGVDRRYAQEWLEQQAVAGFVTVTTPADDPDRRHFGLTEAQAAVLVHADHPSHVSPLAAMVTGIGLVLDRVTDAYRTGDGVPYSVYGDWFRDGQGGINRPAFTHDLVGTWIPSVPGLDERLRGRGTRIADLGSGLGWSALAMADAYPDASVIGIDNDEASVRDARRVAADRKAAVDYVRADASELVNHGPFDLVTILETLHDLARPVDVLSAARRALAPGGIVLVADEQVADDFAPSGDELERMMYGWSVVHCLPASRTESPSAAIGTVIRRSEVESLATEAGFSQVSVPNVDAGFFRLYVLEM